MGPRGQNLLPSRPVRRVAESPPGSVEDEAPIRMMARDRTWGIRPLTSAAGAVLLVVACATSDRATGGDAGGSMGGRAGTAGADQSGGDPGGEGGSGPASGGTSSRGGSSGAGDGSGGEAASSAGGDSAACAPGCEPEAPLCVNGACVECLEDSRRCVGDAPEECRAGSWVSLDQCPTSAPACTNGVCAAARLTGALVSMQGEAAAGGVRLRAHGFESLPRTCADVSGTTVCVNGGLRP
jgi:hypothetical protein